MKLMELRSDNVLGPIISVRRNTENGVTVILDMCMKTQNKEQKISEEHC